MLSISPSQVRTRILAEHTVLRERMDSVSNGVARLRTSPACTAELLTLARELYHTLLAHLDFEDSLLDGTLRTIDAWGTIRAERLASHHAEQRSQLRSLLEAMSRLSAEDLAALVQAAIDELRADMEAEEQDILSPQLLRDDVVAIDGASG